MFQSRSSQGFIHRFPGRACGFFEFGIRNTTVWPDPESQGVPPRASQGIQCLCTVLHLVFLYKACYTDAMSHPWVARPARELALLVIQRAPRAVPVVLEGHRRAEAVRPLGRGGAQGARVDAVEDDERHAALRRGGAPACVAPRAAQRCFHLRPADALVVVHAAVQ